MALPAWLPWLPISISFAGVIVSLFLYRDQVKRARFNQSIDLLFRLENDFFGSAKKAQRAKAARELLSGGSLEAQPILDFFETMALLLRKKALDEEMVWHTFFYWIDHYFEACEDAIAARQRVDPYVWKDLTALAQRLRKYQSTRPNSMAYHPPTPEEVKGFLEEELTEAT